MIKIFFHFFFYKSIPDADGLRQELVKNLFYSLPIPIPNCPAERFPICCVAGDLYPKPGTDLFFVDSKDFLIWNNKTVLTAPGFTGFRQVSGGKENAPQICLTGFRILAVKICVG